MLASCRVVRSTLFWSHELVADDLTHAMAVVLAPRDLASVNQERWSPGSLDIERPCVVMLMSTRGGFFLEG